MDAQIHAALVGGALAGVLGGATVAGGVILDVRVRGRQENRRRLEDAVAQLATENQRLTVNFKTTDDAEFELPDGFVESHRELLHSIDLVRRLAYVTGKDARRIREACADLSDMWTATILRMTHKKWPDVGDALVMAMPVRRMHDALYGDANSREGQESWRSGRLTRYVEGGLTAQELPGRPDQ